MKVRGEVQHLRTAFLVWIALARLWIVLPLGLFGVFFLNFAFISTLKWQLSARVPRTCSW